MTDRKQNTLPLRRSGLRIILAVIVAMAMFVASDFSFADDAAGVSVRIMSKEKDRMLNEMISFDKGSAVNKRYPDDVDIIPSLKPKSVTKIGKPLRYYFRKLPTAKATGYKAANYKFLGWYNRNINGGQKITLDTIVNENNFPVSIGGYALIFAHWGVPVTLKLNANKGKIGKAKVKIQKTYTNLEYGKLPTPKRKGYKFKGWYTKKTGGAKITAKKIIKDKLVADYSRGRMHRDGTPHAEMLPVKQTITLYAHWQKK